MKQMQLLLKNDVITGFSYSFSTALVQALRKMQKNNELTDVDDKDYSHVARAAVTYLCEQINYSGSVGYHANNIEEILTAAEKFLKIFQE